MLRFYLQRACSVALVKDRGFVMEHSNNEKTILGIETHPVPFVKHSCISVKREDALAVILDSLKNYQDHEFHVTPLDYGLMVSVNYENGVFQSMILNR